jgi:peptide/nickel transport system permease protein
VSLRQQQPTWSLVVQRLPSTLQLASAGLAIALCLGIPVGVFAAIRRGSLWDNALMLLGLVGQSMPVFWLGLLLIMVFSVGLGWFPVSGAGGPQHLVLPAVTLGLFSTAYVARMSRSSMLEVLGKDYVRTARGKGLTPRGVVVNHALRNALIPLVTVVGLQAGYLLGGAVITETIFAWPGVGRLTIEAVQSKDLPLVETCVTLLASIFVFVNLVVDLLYAYLDPRIRLG